MDRWANQTHAVAVFGDALAARLALHSARNGPLKDHRWQLRPWAEVSHASHPTPPEPTATHPTFHPMAGLTVCFCPQASKPCRDIKNKELQPPALRPKTTDVVARRLLGHALANNAIRDLVKGPPPPLPHTQPYFLRSLLSAAVSLSPNCYGDSIVA